MKCIIEMGQLDEECDAGDPPAVQWSGLSFYCRGQGSIPGQRTQCAVGRPVPHTVVFGKTRMGLQDEGYVGNFCLFALPIIILFKAFQNNF